ncbi:superfamily II DNA helicase [Candidatus Scalindua japonica]|uniref:Superfamily II DNA helicase n=1 Tax=Candidatus Scalindua japonica TaxID=1284222 RepID=A0A286TYJ0_9BACT|nr:HRDC domain-containing protein [Candidatus Scalindua japonica]GAX60891.1 superfamily II DNA helicase [Candidatus Scalindua japonica]
MKLKIFTFRFCENTGGFNDDKLQLFSMEKEIIEFAEHFFTFEKRPYLTVFLSYRDKPSGSTNKGVRKQDPRSELDEHEKLLYDVVRKWRAARATQEGIPPYMIANNKQVASMVKLKVRSKKDFDAVEGFGEAKISRYAEDIIKTLVGHQEPDSDEKREIKEGED